MNTSNDLTAVYYTANTIPVHFSQNMRDHLMRVLGDLPLVAVVQLPSEPRSHLQIYRNALEGARRATTKYIALCEDDILYSPEHFKYRPSPGKFAYNLGTWNIFTWVEPAVFNHKERRNLSGLICERELFIEAMEERFARWPVDSEVNLSNWAEPGKYEHHLGVTPRESEVFYTNPPNIVFSHETALGFENLGKRKRLGELRATKIPYWGEAQAIKELYDVLRSIDFNPGA